MNETIVSITGLTHEGRGIAHIDGKTTFVSEALPSERVRIEIFKSHRHYNEARVIEILEASPERVTPPCDYFSQCGGCALQHMSPSFQREHKQAAVLDQLQRLGKVIPREVAPALSASDRHYRHKARVGARYWKREGRLVLGFRTRSGRNLVDMQDCYVLEASFAKALPVIQEHLESLSIASFIPQLEIAVSEGIVVVVLRHLKPLTDDDRQILGQLQKRTGFLWVLQAGGPDRLLDLEGQPFISPLSYPTATGTHEIPFEPLDFTQVHPEVNRLMVQQAVSWLSPSASDTVLDLFCGLGNFSFPLSEYAGSVRGIDGAPKMIERAQRNANLQKIDHLSFEVGDLHATPLPLLPKASLVLLDPPRAGAEAVVQSMASISPKRVLYVSCNPATLARDLGILVHTQGYTLDRVGVVDMFPHTEHVETMALLVKGP